MNPKILAFLFLLISSITVGSLLYTAPSQEEKRTETFAGSPQDTDQQSEDSIAQPSFSSPSGVSSDREEQDAFGQSDQFSQIAPGGPEKNVSPGVGQAITQLACDTANAVGSVDPDGRQYNCPPPQTSSVSKDNSTDFAAAQTPTTTTQQEATQQIQSQTTQAMRLHETVTDRFPANGSYPDGLDIDGWPVRCGDTPIEVVETFYESTDPNGRGRYDGYRMSDSREKIQGNTTSRRILLSSSALKTKRTLTKLYQFYHSCARSQHTDTTERACWVAEKGKKDGWLTEDGVQFLCRETSSIVCQGLKHCFSGPPPAQSYTEITSTDPLAQQHTNDFPQEGNYPPGSLSIDGIPVRCGDTPIRILSDPGTGWLGTAVLDQNVIHLNRSNLIRTSTAGKLAVFADECAHITYQASNYEAGCGSWAIRKQNGWIDSQNVKSYCRNAETNFYAGGFYLENTSPEEACQRVKGCYSGSIQPVQGSVWGR